MDKRDTVKLFLEFLKENKIFDSYFSFLKKNTITFKRLTMVTSPLLYLHSVRNVQTIENMKFWDKMIIQWQNLYKSKSNE